MYVGRRWPSQIIKRVKLGGQICIGNLENEDDGCFEANGGNDIVVDKVGCLVQWVWRNAAAFLVILMIINSIMKTAMVLMNIMIWMMMAGI